MRIIGGKNKGKKLKSFEGDAIRPTSDRARESLFNILAPRLLGAEFLDLCSGTGAVGIEAISRGASLVTFVDVSRESAKIAEFNLKSISSDIKVNLSDAKKFVSQTYLKFDIIFFDPPYAFQGFEDILSIVKERNLLKDGGVFIYEHKVDKPSVEIDGYVLKDTRKYGIAIFDFYCLKGEV